MNEEELIEIRDILSGLLDDINWVSGKNYTNVNIKNAEKIIEKLNELIYESAN